MTITDLGPTVRIAGNWRGDAACRTENPELFYPVGTGKAAAQQAEIAKTVCRRCPVRDACLADVLDRGDTWAIAGGTTAEERDQLKRGNR